MKKQTKKKKVLIPIKNGGADIVYVEGNKRIHAETKSTTRHGPRKEKVQISVRLSKAYMDLAYAHIKRTNTRITDLLERGLALAMAEEVKMPKLTQSVRFLVANTTTEQQRVLKNALVWLAIPELPDYRLNVFEELTRSLFLQTTAAAEQLGETKCENILRLYHRYGRSTEARGPAELPAGE